MEKVILHTCHTCEKAVQNLKRWLYIKRKDKDLPLPFPFPSRVLAGWGSSVTVKASSVPMISGGWWWEGTGKPAAGVT